VSALGLLITLGGVAGCSSGGDPRTAPPTAASATSGGTEASGVSGATGGADGAARVTPSDRADATATPTSEFEDDPAVQALRVHYLGSAKAVNAKTFDIPELARSSTKTRLQQLPALFRFEFGDHYPGPIPFTPVSVSVVTATKHTVLICVLGDGWLQDPATGKPTKPRKLYQGVATVIKQGSTWRVDDISETGGSCDGVSIQEVPFR
jgi:hypothetical protein